MSQCIVPNWNLKHQRQELVEGEEGNRSSHVHNPSSHLVPMYGSTDEVAELTWVNGQLAMHGIIGMLPTSPTKPPGGRGRANETLESIVHQATCHNQQHNVPKHDHHQTPANIGSMAAATGAKWAESSVHTPMMPALMKKRARARSELENYARNFRGRIQEELPDPSACASASATVCRDTDTTMMTWASFESPPSLKTKTTDEDSDSHGGSGNRDEDGETKTETGRSHSTRRSRAAAIHNQSERRRRDRINQKMKTLQKLVPNASKTDKASMLDEVIEYLKQLQAQVQMMSVRSMPQMLMPLGIQQQQLQMSLLARMGMGVGLGRGMGLFDMSTMARAAQQSLPQLVHPAPVAAAAATPAFVPPPFVVPPMIPAQASSDPASNNLVSMPDPYCAFLAQSMNLDLYNKMAALYQQQVNQTMQAAGCNPSQSNKMQSD